MPPEPVTFVSVVVPIRNEGRTIASCLDGLLAQDYPADRTEILVVDGASDDGTPDVVAELAARAPRVRLLHNPDRHAAPAMNVGIAAARGDIVARVDGHAIVPPDFLSRCVAALERRRDVDCVSGVLETRGRTTTGRAIAAAMSSTAGVGPARFRTGAPAEVLVDTVAFPVYRRTTLARLGPFDEELVRNQDDELNLRLTRAGGRILLLPDLRIVYFCQSTLAGLARQYWQYGFWKVRVIQKHRRAASWRHLVPCALVGTIAGVPLLATVVPALRVPALAMVCTYALAIAGAALRLGREHGIALAPRIAAALVILHLAYGAGFWKGLATFTLARPARPAPAPVATGR